MFHRICSLLYLFWLIPGLCSAWFPRTVEESLVVEGRTEAVIGSIKPYIVGRDETLIEVAHRAGIGYRNLVAANPGVDVWLPQPGHELLLPYTAILPASIGEGITINLAEYRLYLLWKEKDQLRVRIYPIGLGREGWSTPEGHYQVVEVATDPVWVMPEGIRAEHSGRPVIVPPGPDNPLGSHWIGLSADGYGIHGTNRPYGIGRRVSHGCIRLYPRDIRDLVEKVKIGTPVRIIYQPVKAGVRDGRLFVEVHDDYLGRVKDPVFGARQRIAALSENVVFDSSLLEKILREARGLPQPATQ